MIVIGIDPGSGGAIAPTRAGVPLGFYDMPTKKVGNKTEICPVELADILIDCTKSEPAIGIIEQVGASPRMGVSSAFNFGHSFGLIKGVCAGLEIPTDFITPKKWKTLHGLLKAENKDASRIKLLKMFPQFSEELKRKKDVDRAEAALIALAWNTLKG